MSKIEKIETERLILRELEESDAEEAYRNWTSDDDVSRYVRWSTHKNVNETREYIKAERKKSREEDFYSWGIVLKENNELIGAIVAFPSEDERYEIGYNIAKKHWNNGYTTEAAKKVLDYLVKEKDIHRFVCSHATLNPASGAVMKKAGFKYVKDDVYEKFDGSKKYEKKVYYLDL